MKKRSKAVLVIGDIKILEEKQAIMISGGTDPGPADPPPTPRGQGQGTQTPPPPPPGG